MLRNHTKYILVSLVLSPALSLPLSVPALAQECAEDGNQFTRGADVELSYAARADDPVADDVRYQRALEKLEASFELDSDLPRSYLLAATAYLGLREFASADSMLTRLVELEPACSDHVAEMRFNAWVPWYNRGITQLKAGDEAAALEAFEKANVVYEDARSLNNAASIYQGRGENERAVTLYERALLAGGDEDMIRAASINLAELYRAEGKDDEALAIYSEYAASHPDDILGRLNYAIALMDSGDTEAAEEMFTELIARDDLSFHQWSQVGIGLYRAENFGPAAEAFQRAHAMNPYNKETLENLANTYYQAELYDALVPVADTLVQRYPYEVINYNLLANARRELDDPEGALAILQRRDGLAFQFLRIQLAPRGENSYLLGGTVINKTADGGTEVSVPVDVIGEDGGVIMTEPLLITLPAQGEASAFQLEVQMEQPVRGFRYHVAGS
jgi:tetratricopeptide (TPR) repeat protein